MTKWLPQHEIVLTREQIAARVDELGQEISRDYKGRLPILVCVLRGAFMFTADLIRAIDIPIRVEFMGVSSYGTDTETSGAVKITKDLDMAIDGRDIIIVEDIVDTGLTLNYLMNLLAARRPRSTAVCALLDKPARRLQPVKMKYTGFKIPDQFVAGYGLDCAHRFREVPFLFAITGDRPEADPTETE